MRNRFQMLAVLLVCSLAALGSGGKDSVCSQTAAGPTTVIVVRHAEKASPEGDPPLSAVGERRAVALCGALGSADIKAIYSADTKRTLGTVRGVAKRLALTVNLYDSPEKLAHTILAKNLGDTVLVVSHSGVVEKIVAALGAKAQKCPIDDEYDNLWVVTIPSIGEAEVLRFKYGDIIVPESCGKSSARR